MSPSDSNPKKKKPPAAWSTGPFDGKKAVAELLAQMRPEEQARWLQTLEKESGVVVAEAVKAKLFRFEKLFEQSPEVLRQVLGQIPLPTLALALRGAPEEWLVQVRSQLTQRAGQALQEALEAQGPQRSSKIWEAQQQVLGVLERELAR